MNITHEIHIFREVARHLWNTYLRRDADFDSVDVFAEICRMLFEEQIISRLGISVPPIPLDTEGDYILQYKIHMKEIGKLSLKVNRDMPPSGYWDYPVGWIPPEENHDIRPISFYDFDVLGWRKFEFYRVRLVRCASHPELTGRDALISCDSVDIEVYPSGMPKDQ